MCRTTPLSFSFWIWARAPDIFVQISGLVDAVDKSEIDIVRIQLTQKPVHAPPDLLHICGPAVLPGGVVRAEVHLQIHLFPASGKSGPIAFEGGGLGNRHVKVVDAMFYGGENRLRTFSFTGLMESGPAEADHTDFFRTLREPAVFH